MRICFAIKEDKGMESPVYNHFGSAPAFIIVDTEINTTFLIKNRDLNHIKGACSPLSAIGGNNVDAVVVGGIGAGAIRGLNAAGIKVYRSLKATVKENLSLLADNMLPEFNMSDTCKSHEGACGH